jgi:hypothetical protein
MAFPYLTSKPPSEHNLEAYGINFQCILGSKLMPSYLSIKYSSTRSHLEAPTLQDRSGVSGDFTELSSTNGALCAVKEIEEGNASHVDLTQHLAKSSVTTSAVLHRA